MPCYHPVGLVRDRKILHVKCGQCIGCRLARSREWAVRCVHEASLYEANAFVTLTYAPGHLPVGGSLVASEIPEFIRRLRRRCGSRSVRYFACGEYGDVCQRPHYHALLFGFYPGDAEFSHTTDAGEKVYVSADLDQVWGLGRTLTGAVTFESAAYVARYVAKKITGAGAKEHYESVDTETGEVFSRLPERSWMSLKPGIGQGWLQRYLDDVYPSDEVVVRGHRNPVPRYYDKLLELGRPDLLESLKLGRIKRGAARSVGDVPTLRAEEVVKQAQVGFLKRSLEG